MAEAAEALRALAAAAAGNRRVARAIGDWAAVLQFELTGETGPFHAIIAGGRLEVREGRHPKPTATITGDGPALARAARGEIDITHLLAGGSADYRGQYYDLINFSRVALAQRRT